MIHKLRGAVLPAVVVLAVLFGLLGWRVDGAWYVGLALFGPLAAIGIYDVLQTEHSILRNYPILGHLRFALEDLGPELHQYIVESDIDGRPFNRDERSLMYERAKNVMDKKPFGTELDVYAEGYAWLAHTMAPKPLIENASESLRVEVGGPGCTQPYSASVLNVSSMSFGALSANAVRAMNLGARKGGFAHWTGEGGCSRYHKEHGGDLVWQIGTGYFGCRTSEGCFDPDMFGEQARDEHVKMIEIKLSQGAKPGHGGVLPAAKVSSEIAEARRVPVGKECVSPSGHSAFSTPVGLLEFVARLRELSGGKPVGFKLCMGEPREFLGVCKAMLETGITPDFITVDGAEGGTGAAPIEFSNHLGMPLVEGLVIVNNAVVGIGLKDRVRIAASGKRVTAFDIAVAMTLGADWCNVARGFMLSVGCIQAQQCHTNRCPVGVTTQDPGLQRALVVSDKGERAYHFHKNTVEALAELLAATGVEHPAELDPSSLFVRLAPGKIRRMSNLFDFLEPGQLLDGSAPEPLASLWNAASAKSFQAT
jgi:glutamate synthase domain-containing protein 2